MLGSLLVLLLAAAGLVCSQAASQLPPCGQTCLSNLIAQATQLGCPGGADSCLCTKPNFSNGVHDCSLSSCPADQFPTVTNYMIALCATATIPPVASSTVSAGSTPPALAATSSASSPALSSSTSSSVSPVVPSAAVQSALPTSPATTVTSVSSSSSSPASAPAVTTSSPSAANNATAVASTTVSSSSSADPAAAPDGTSSPASSSSAPPSTGLTTEAKIGVGVGAAAGGVALTTLLVYILITRRQKKRRGDGNLPYQISEPLPGSGRTYANDHHHRQYEAGMSELELRSKRYEDMLPRQSPRTMV